MYRNKEIETATPDPWNPFQISAGKVWISMVCWLFLSKSLAQEQLKSKALLEYSNEKLETVIEEIASMNQMTPLYTSRLVEHKAVSFECNHCSTHKALNTILEKFELSFKVIDDQLLIRKKKAINSTRILDGSVTDDLSKEVIPWAAIYYQKSLRGEVSGENGKFTIPVSTSDINDTLVISCVGFEKTRIPVVELENTDFLSVTLEKSAVLLGKHNISAADYQFKNYGVSGKKEHAAVYLDTHGQQVAYLVKGEKNTGTLTTAWFFLSPEGNMTAPFRIRAYSTGSTEEGPQEDLIRDFVMAQPTGKKGWYEVDFEKYQLQVPGEGLFLAIEGIFPSQKVSATYTAGRTNKRRQALKKLTYGQKLGVRKTRKSNTWHYSLSRTWFQLPEPSYDAMIKVNIRYRKEEENEN